MLRQPILAASVVVVVLAVAAALAPAAFTGTDPLRVRPAAKLHPPGGAHLFGTDQLGRDLFARVVHGAGLSLSCAAIAVLVGLVAGSLVGLAAGFVGGMVDAAVMRLVDVVLSVPSLLLATMLVTAFGFGPVQTALAVGTSSIASFARLMRAEAMRVRDQAYVEAAFVAGARPLSVLRRHILPHTRGPVLALTALEFGGAILAVAALGFLGFGAQPPTPEWGALVADGRGYLDTGWWMTAAPGLVVVVTVLALNRISQAFDTPAGPR
ncbi:putative membrane component of ABC-type dipeptide/oligopeptide/nickel transport systems [Frankia alni ACN14a]|uniref:Membrane component of ABC-type dipeptide/oligopeptide/nickel transport systems n=1 Tax=Frankia alni (strain DSM 45986 / CECT 9034 / ACN14a) TaxID=326424 RepID=Q0RIC7_FRAAA|nr:putative membrane component of ABC-type dipeptide/oligopeptide/nickel transport systems [Frankia alni ACN14a]